MKTPVVQFYIRNRRPHGGRFDRPTWGWRLKAANGAIIAAGAEGYASRRNARRAWQTVRAIARNVLRGQMLLAAVMLWRLWVTDPTTGTPVAPPLGRFTTLDACVHQSYRIGLTTGITVTCLPYTFAVEPAE